MRRKKVEAGDRVPVRLSARQRELLFEETFVDSAYAKRLRSAKSGSYFVGEFTLDDLEDILGYVASAANHADDDRLEEELDQLWGHLRHIQGSYDDGNWQDSC